MDTVGIIIWLLATGLCTALFGGIGLWAARRKTPIHFWSGEEIPAEKVSDVPAWNAAYAKMWGAYAACYALSGLLVFWSQTAAIVLLVLSSTVGCGVLVAVNERIRKKYWVK